MGSNHGDGNADPSIAYKTDDDNNEIYTDFADKPSRPKSVSRRLS